MISQRFLHHSIEERVEVIRKHYEINNEIVINNELFGNKSYPISIFRNLKQQKIMGDEYYPILFITKKIFNENKCKEGLEFTFKSDIPYGMGLGSSAAAAVVQAALSKYLIRK
jgi:homoserine kinase